MHCCCSGRGVKPLVNGGYTHEFITELRNDSTIPDHRHTPDPTFTPPPVLSRVLGQGDIELSLFTMISTFGTPHDITADETRFEAFFPGDNKTEIILRALSEKGLQSIVP